LVVADEGRQDFRADADGLKGDYGILLSVGVARKHSPSYQTIRKQQRDRSETLDPAVAGVQHQAAHIASDAPE